MNISDTDRIEWLRDRITYLEHNGSDGTPCIRNIGCFWPQDDDGQNTSVMDPTMIGLGLIEYIDAQIERCRK